MKGFLGNNGVENFELDVPDGFLAQGALSGSPLEALNNGLASAVQQTFVNLRGQGVVHKNIRPRRVRTESPNTSGGQKIPVVFLLEKFSELLSAKRSNDFTSIIICLTQNGNNKNYFSFQ